MRQWMLFAITGLVMIVCLQRSALAQWQSSMPPGDYGQTCQDMRMNGSLLEARCQKRDGGWRTSSLDMRGCRGQASNVINDDGYLRCGESAGYNQPGWQGAPSGDYTQTCRNIRRNGD